MVMMMMVMTVVCERPDILLRGKGAEPRVLQLDAGTHVLPDAGIFPGDSLLLYPERVMLLLVHPKFRPHTFRVRGRVRV
jgi:hypothetical protein